MGVWLRPVRGLTRRSIWGGLAIGVAGLVPLLVPAHHREDSGHLVDFASIEFDWFGHRWPIHMVPCWPMILAMEGGVLALGGAVLTWLARRPPAADARRSE